MSTGMIHIVGSPLRAGLFGVLLAQRWAGSGRRIVLELDETKDEPSSILLRPEARRVHAELGVSEAGLLKETQGEPVFAYSVEANGAQIILPFSPFGLPRNGVEFHHYWKRAQGLGSQEDLSAYSLALALQGLDPKPQPEGLERLPVDYGLRLDRKLYASLLLELAKPRGVTVLTDGGQQPERPDLLIDCRNPEAASQCASAQIIVGGASAIQGVEWQVCANAAKRLAQLSADLSNWRAERAEYERLTLAERERISDMEELLAADDLSRIRSSTLKRKIDVFVASGRIPKEDFEVFSPPEWLAALWGKRIRPRRYSRMADTLPEAELLQWLEDMKKQIAQISNMGRPT